MKRIVCVWLLMSLLLAGCNAETVPPTADPNHTHKLQEMPAKAPEALVDGNYRYYKCTVPYCGALFKDFTGKTPVSWADVVIPAAGFETYRYHDFDGSSFQVDQLAHIANNHACQGTAIWEDTLVICKHTGYCYLYTLPKGEYVGEFPLVSFNDGETAEQNHCNQMMFGPEKFAQSDPFPLLYVTTGYSNDHDPSGAYWAKCSVERILQDESGRWYAELVQTIEFNDAANIPDENINGTLTKMYRDGKFPYVSGNGYDAAAGYEKIGYGWPHFYVDMAPTESTAGKLFIWSTRFRASEYWENENKKHYDFGGYEKDNNYIITQFALPPLPESETDPAYGTTVTLQPKDIQHQFQTPFTTYAFQGGTMYRGKIYHSFGDGQQNVKHRDNIVVWDIAQEAIVATLPLHKTAIAALEPECVCIYNGELALSTYNMDKNNMAVDLFIFGYVADPKDPENPVCLVCGEALRP